MCRSSHRKDSQTLFPEHARTHRLMLRFRHPVANNGRLSAPHDQQHPLPKRVSFSNDGTCLSTKPLRHPEEKLPTCRPVTLFTVRTHLECLQMTTPFRSTTVKLSDKLKIRSAYCSLFPFLRRHVSSPFLRLSAPYYPLHSFPSHQSQCSLHSFPLFPSSSHASSPSLTPGSPPTHRPAPPFPPSPPARPSRSAASTSALCS